MDFAHKIIIALLIILIGVIVFTGKQENAGSVSGSTNYSAEAIQMISKVYADSKNTASFNNNKIYKGSKS